MVAYLEAFRQVAFLLVLLCPEMQLHHLSLRSSLQLLRLILLPAFFISTLIVGLNFASDGLANALGLDAARGLHGA